MIKNDLLLRITGIFLLLLPILYPIVWHPNEYAYFGLAKHHISPLPNSMLYAVNNHQFSRFVNDYTIGIFIKLFGYDQAWVILRFLTLLAYSASLAYLTRAMKISLLPALAALFVFLRVGQTYFAGEWLFNGVEAKTFAYPLVFVGFALILANRIAVAIVCFVLAAYFHFLVGGFWGTAALVYAFLATKDKALIKYYLYYLLAFVPIVGMLIYENHQLPAPDLTGFNFTLNQIYSNIRHPHHTAPFNGGSLSSSWRYGAVFIVLNSLALAAINYFKITENTKVVNWLMLLHVYLLSALLIAFFDKDTQYLGKFYLFRPAALTLLLTLFIFSEIAYRYLSKFKAVSIIAWLMLIGVILIPMAKKIPQVRQGFGLSLFDSLSTNEKLLVDWVKNNTLPTDIIMFEESKGIGLSVESFEQLAERPSLVSWKFVPITNYDLARWYRLVNLKKSAYAGDCLAFKTLAANYLIAITDISYKHIEQCGSTVFSTGHFNVIQLKIE